MEDGAMDADLDEIGIMIDRAGRTGDSGLTRMALRLLDMFAERTRLGDADQVLAHYFRANALENRLREKGIHESWEWTVPLFGKIVLELRRAIRHPSFDSIDPLRQCQILTNLGNRLHSLGRPVEAIAHWRQALRIMPEFGMAHANLGRALVNYATALHDEGHAGLVFGAAHDALMASSMPGAIYDTADNAALQPRFSHLAAGIAERFDVNTAHQALRHGFPLGQLQAEVDYRKWTLRHGLFLNPLNDLGPFTIAAHDVLHLPSMVRAAKLTGPRPPAAYGFFNQIKQEFLSARWLCHEGASDRGVHFSDRDSLIFDTLDYACHSLAVEKTKISFRMAFSLFDRIAFFLNDYYALGLSEREVSFRSIWFEPRGEPRRLAERFRSLPNWPLRGLFWLSLDLHDPMFDEAAEPGAEGIAELRNRLEHRSCQVHQADVSRAGEVATTLVSPFRIDREELEVRTLNLLRKTRAAMIYLSLAVHDEEKRRGGDVREGAVGTMPLWELAPEVRR